MSQLAALFVVAGVLLLAAVVGVWAVQSRRLDSVWGLGAALTIFPAALATMIATGLSECHSIGCVSGAEKDQLHLAIAALPVLAVGLVLGLRPYDRLHRAAILLAQVLTAVAIWKSNAAGAIFLGVVAAGEVAYELSGRLRSDEAGEQV